MINERILVEEQLNIKLAELMNFCALKGISVRIDQTLEDQNYDVIGLMHPFRTMKPLKSIQINISYEI